MLILGNKALACDSSGLGGIVQLLQVRVRDPHLFAVPSTISNRTPPARECSFQSF